MLHTATVLKKQLLQGILCRNCPIAHFEKLCQLWRIIIQHESLQPLLAKNVTNALIERKCALHLPVKRSPVFLHLSSPLSDDNALPYVLRNEIRGPWVQLALAYMIMHIV